MGLTCLYFKPDGNGEDGQGGGKRSYGFFRLASHDVDRNAKNIRAACQHVWIADE